MGKTASEGLNLSHKQSEEIKAMNTTNNTRSKQLAEIQKHLEELKAKKEARKSRVEVEKVQAEPACLTPSPKCEKAVRYAMNEIKSHPAWYPGLTGASTYEDFQAHGGRQGSGDCHCSAASIAAFAKARTEAKKPELPLEELPKEETSQGHAQKIVGEADSEQIANIDVVPIAKLKPVSTSESETRPASTSSHEHQVKRKAKATRKLKNKADVKGK